MGEPRALEDFIELNLGEHGLDSGDFDFEISMDSGDDYVFELDGFDPLAPFLIAEQYGESLSQADVQSALAGDVLERLAFMLGDIDQEALVDNAPDALAQAAASELVSMLGTSTVMAFMMSLAL